MNNTNNNQNHINNIVSTNPNQTTNSNNFLNLNYLNNNNNNNNFYSGVASSKNSIVPLTDEVRFLVFLCENKLKIKLIFRKSKNSRSKIQ